MQRIHFALLVLLVAAAIVRARQYTPEPPRRDLLSIALPGAALLVTFDLAALRADKGDRKVVERLETLLREAAPVTRCPATLLGDVTRVALVIPAETPTRSRDEVAVLAEGRLKAKAVLDCAQALVEVREGEVERSKVGAFSLLRDRRKEGSIAVRDGGPLISGGGAYFRELLGRAGGAAAPAPGPREGLHSALRAELGPEPLLATLVLSPGWLEHWLGDLSGVSSPLAAARVVALTATLDDPVVLHAVIGAKDAPGAEEIEGFVRRLLPDSGMIAGLLGFGGIRLAGFTRDGQRVSVELWLPASLLFEALSQARTP